MKRIFLILICLLLAGCSGEAPAQVAATTLPVYEFTTRLCQGTDITVTRLVTESVSCLHDYSLNVRQVKAIEAAELVIVAGAGLEEYFMGDLLQEVLDASQGIVLLEGEADDHDGEDGHSHESDPHIWLSPENAMVMAQNICDGLTAQYPGYASIFSENLAALLAELEALQAYGEAQLSDLSVRGMITFHDGFGYFADAVGLEILEAVEEESGSEASAQELKHLITLVQENSLPAVFTETNGSTSAAQVIARETGAEIYCLDMAMSGESYFEAMYHNIDTIKEAMG